MPAYTVPNSKHTREELARDISRRTGIDEDTCYRVICAASDAPESYPDLRREAGLTYRT